MADIAFFLGALVPTFALSRLMLWLMKSWNGGRRRLIVVHAFALLIASFVGGMGMADGGTFAGLRAMTQYALPQGL
jgi:hypothetical protein